MDRNKQSKIILFSTATLVIILLLLFSNFAKHKPSNSMLKDNFWASKTINNPINDIVYIGDSRVYRGINPKVIQAVFNNTLVGFNFGFSSAGLSPNFIIEGVKKLNPKGKKILMVGVSANSFYSESLQNEHFNEILNTPKKDLWVKKHIYPYISGLCSYSLSDVINVGSRKSYYENFNFESGFVSSCKFPIDTNSALKSYENHLKTDHIDTANIGELLTTFEKLKTQGYKIIFTRVPASFSMFQLEDKFSQSIIKIFEEKTKALGYKWIEHRPTQKTYDGSHLIDKYSIQYSKDIAQALKILK